MGQLGPEGCLLTIVLCNASCTVTHSGSVMASVKRSKVPEAICGSCNLLSEEKKLIDRRSQLWRTFTQQETATLVAVSETSGPA